MHKIRNKKLALLMTIVFVLTIMMPLATPASANTSYSALTTPTVTTGFGQVLGTLYVKIDPIAPGVHSAIISLPTDYELLVDDQSDLGGSVAWAVYKTGFDKNELKLVFDNTGMVTDFSFILPLTATIPSGATGDVTATILNLSGQLQDGSVVLAKLDKSAVTVSAGTPEYISGDGTVTFTIRENAAGALKQSDQSVKLTLPKGFTWSGNAGKANLSGDAGYTLAIDNDKRVLYVGLDVGDVSTVKSIIRFTADIEVNELDAKYGDVVATIGGKSSVSPSKLVVAKYADFGFKASVEDATETLAGRINEEVGKITIEETAPGSFIPGRTILLTLPIGAKWNPTETDYTLDCPNLTLAPTLGFPDSDTLRLTLKNDVTTKAGKIIIEDVKVSTAVNFKGDLTVKVAGSAGVKDELLLATVKAPISVTAEKPNVKIGVQGQTAGNITITEAEAEALIHKKTLTIKPILAGVSFDATPKVEVTEGDIEVDLRKSADQLTLTIDGDSTKASTIKISGITYTVNRSFPEGSVELSFSGNAVDEVNAVTVPLFDKDRTAAKAVNAVCVTPAPGDSKQSATFVIGSSTYIINNVEATMDVVPYVKDGRTYLPVRYVGYALGVAAENILWDGKTATLIKGDKVVQVTAGSKVMVVNGASINLDAAPELKDGRTMLPFRWIAWAFGASVNWDGASQTVTMEL